MTGSVGVNQDTILLRRQFCTHPLGVDVSGFNAVDKLLEPRAFATDILTRL